MVAAGFGRAFEFNQALGFELLEPALYGAFRRTGLFYKFGRVKAWFALDVLLKLLGC